MEETIKGLIMLAAAVIVAICSYHFWGWWGVVFSSALEVVGRELILEVLREVI